ncbi:hypothetical protein ACNF42_04160 [Cuniculiplasma sp. SKW3]|uniref:hypothetical protein n=1 Tax=unclassified Cuniculiplasma TaxID=2619706 RepID=UPI003FD4D429
MIDAVSGLIDYYYLIFPVLLINLGFAFNLLLRGNKSHLYSIVAIILIVFVILILTVNLIKAESRFGGISEFSILYAYATTVLSGIGFFVGYITGGKA